MTVTGNEYVRLSQLKMLSDGLESGASGNKVNVAVSNMSSSSIALFYYDFNNNSYTVSTLAARGSTNIGTLTGQYLVAAYDGVNDIHTCSMGGSMYANKLFAVLIPEYANEEQLLIMSD